MRPARIIAVVMFAAALAIIGCSADSTATNPSSAPQPTTAAPPPAAASTSGPQPGGGAVTRPSTPSSPGGCDASALQGSVLGSDGAAGTIWTTIRLRNTSAQTCTVKGIPQVRLLGDQGQLVTAPSVPDGPVGSLVRLRPGQAAHFSFSRPNACDALVAGSRLRVTLPAGQGSLVVPLGTVTGFGTCASVRVRALQVSTTRATPPVDRISDPQVAADRLVAAWLRGDRAAALTLTSPAVTERLFAEPPPARTLAALPCRPVPDPAVYVCSYPLAERAELSLFVVGDASAGYRVSGIEFGD